MLGVKGLITKVNLISHTTFTHHIIYTINTSYYNNIIYTSKSEMLDSTAGLIGSDIQLQCASEVWLTGGQLTCQLLLKAGGHNKAVADHLCSWSITYGIPLVL